MNAAFWRDRPVLVTGASGFVGSALTARLVSAGARVVGLVRDQVAESNLVRLGVDRAITIVRGSLENSALVERTINEYAVEVVYHLAAQATVAVANRSPLSTFKANVEGTWNVLEACRGKSHVLAVVVASSDKAYGFHDALPYREEFPLNPDYPYDVSKACADLIARSYFKTYALPVVVTRFANIYGPGDSNFSRLVPETVRSVLRGSSPVIRSDGRAERDYLYIDDAVDLYLLLAERIEDARGEVFNAGRNQPVSVLDLVRTILRLAGRADIGVEVLATDRVHGEIQRQSLDGSKASEMLGWQPRIDLEEGLRRTLAWHEALAVGGADAATTLTSRLFRASDRPDVVGARLGTRAAARARSAPADHEPEWRRR